MSEGPLLVGICNPLLDISAHVGEDFLKKYSLQGGSACLASPEQMPIYAELAAMPATEFIPGGSGLNTIRVAQWVLRRDGAAAYIGATNGSDDYHHKLDAESRREGVSMLLASVPSEPTGSCAVCIVDKERSMCANLGASAKCPASHFDTPAVRSALGSVRVCYVTGFFLTSSIEGAMSALRQASATGALCAFNISAEFVAKFFTAAVVNALAWVDIVVCNEAEIVFIGSALGVPAAAAAEPDRVAIAAAIADLPVATGKRLRAGGRLVVVTQGSRATLVVERGVGRSFPVPALPASALVDTNGAGDAFAGGFLSQLAVGETLAMAVECGHYCAREVVQRSGCQLPLVPNWPPRGPLCGEIAPALVRFPCVRPPVAGGDDWGVADEVKWADLKGKVVVAVFLPQVLSFVCPTEVTALMAGIRAGEFPPECVVAVCVVASTDALRGWVQTPAERRGLGGPFPGLLVGDVTGSLARQFGVLTERGTAARVAFVIDAHGTLRASVAHDGTVGRSVPELAALAKAAAAAPPSLAKQIMAK